MNLGQNPQGRNFTGYHLTDKKDFKLNNAKF